MNRFRNYLAVFVAAMTASVLCLTAIAQNADPIPTETKQDAVRRSMHEKSQQAQAILPALVMSDFDAIKEAAAKLKTISLQAPADIEGDDTENELYQHFRLEFLRVTSQLEKMASDENLEGTAYAYEKLTANCLACHSYLTSQSE